MDPGFSCTPRLVPPTWRCVLCQQPQYGRCKTYCDRCVLDVVEDREAARCARLRSSQVPQEDFPLPS